VIDTCSICDATTALATDGQWMGGTPTMSSPLSISAESASMRYRAPPLKLGPRHQVANHAGPVFG
jgi:hypothetical protein